MHVVKVRQGGIVRRAVLIDEAGEEVVLVTRFLAHLADSGYSPNTLCAYAYDLRHLALFLRCRAMSWSEFKPSSALEFLGYLRRVPSRRPAQRRQPGESDRTGRMDFGQTAVCSPSRGALAVLSCRSSPSRPGWARDPGPVGTRAAVCNLDRYRRGAGSLQRRAAGGQPVDRVADRVPQPVSQSFGQQRRDVARIDRRIQSAMTRGATAHEQCNC